MLDLEPYIDDALGTLRGLRGGLVALDGMIDIENGRHSDFRIPKPDPESGYEFGVELALGRLPVVEVAVPEEALTNFSLEQLDATAAIELVARGWVGLDAEVNDKEKLARANYRFGKALLNTLLQPHAFGQSVTVSAVRANYALNPQTRESEQVTASSLLIFTIGDVETRDLG